MDKETRFSTVGTVIEISEESRCKLITTSERDPRKAYSKRASLTTRLMHTLTLAYHAAADGGDVEGAEMARRRWSGLHSSR